MVEKSLTFSRYTLGICSLTNKMNVNKKYFWRDYKPETVQHNNKNLLYLKNTYFF